ncbi:MAG TPA: MarR family transcriptional regulator [Micromonosporaceae bacterium]|nr:MarR family transcriptional regulator [Micromonosporaceae bacterium]HCU48392.1 MarR family transcriptional regulator [Micromonosporaceae bacterium]
MHEQKWLPEDQLQAWHYFVETSHLLEQRIDRNLRQHYQLSHAQYEILTRLSGALNNRMRMTELADRIVTAKSSLTYQMDQLVQRGLAARENDNADARAVYAVLTQDGRHLLDQVGPTHLAIVREYLLDVLTAEQLAALTQSMKASWKRLRTG